MNQTINFRRGLDLNLQGSIAPGTVIKSVAANKVAIIPDDFPGFIPRLTVKEGDSIQAGNAVMQDKNTPDICLVSPISGVVKHVVRGERRKILRVVIESDAVTKPAAEGSPLKYSGAQELKLALMRHGLWALMRQRPYDIIPDADTAPRDIFITCFDSSPLAPDLDNEVEGKNAEIAAAIKALLQLTNGNIYMSVRADSNITVPDGAKKVVVNGPHPAGNAGVQAAAIAPVNKGETIWTLDVVTLARIGSLLINGKVDWSATVAVTGSEIKEPCLVKTTAGASVADLLTDNIKNTDKHIRIISGNVLTGHTVGNDGFLRYPYRQITVIPEGDDVDEFMGWASLSPSKMSVNRSFPSRLLPKRKFSPDARLLGGRRAMIMSGEYDKVLPMDILPEYLIKAIISRDIDKMEALGIYEVAPEDFALCEYVDPSKLELQKIVRQGLDYLRKELD